MSDTTRITNPIEIKDNSVERVALELMEKIIYVEGKTRQADYLQPNPREYYLKLYNQCHKIISISGIEVKDVL